MKSYFPIFKGFDWAVEKLYKNIGVLFVLFLFGLAEYVIYISTYFGYISGFQMVIISGLIVLGLHVVITNAAVKLYKNEHASIASFFSIKFSMIFTLIFAYLIIDSPNLFRELFGNLFPPNSDETIIITGIFLLLLIIYNYMFPVILDQDMGLLRSFKESGRISNGIRWKLFGWLVLVFLGMLIAIGIWIFLFANTGVGYLIEFTGLPLFVVVVHMVNVYVYFERKKIL